MARIFLCYRRDDTGKYLPNLLESLRKTLPPEAIFVDKISLNAGDDFRLRIYQELYNADAVLALIGENWADRFSERQPSSIFENEDHLRVELETALRLRKSVIPVIIAPAKRPDSDAIPKTISELTRLHTIDIDMGSQQSLDGLSSAVKKTLDLSFDARISNLASRLGINSGAVHHVFESIGNLAQNAKAVDIIGAAEICEAVATHAKSRFGEKWWPALTRLGLVRSEDVGIIVYSLILEDIIEREPADQPSDFWGLGSFEQ